jgi:hypothetical protein
MLSLIDGNPRVKSNHVVPLLNMNLDVAQNPADEPRVVKLVRMGTSPSPASWVRAPKEDSFGLWFWTS